ncbi:MAG TPA: FAD-dependent oxidoreductase, partial [Xanthobacteraceae bacterium]|nr:FAD-dependent oxidoreductase [Xanthobacteraceae bacterium]
MPHFDAIVIGSGQAGPSLTGRLTETGQTVAFIEREHFGGTCVNDGCIPTKALVASAQAAYVARRGADFGVRISGAIDVDMKAVKARKDAIVARSRGNVEKWVRGMRGCTVYFGSARFTGPKQVGVNGEILTAEKIFINVGGRPSVPPIPGLDTVPHLTNTSMMDVDFLPEHLVVLGGSYIGLEFAQMYRRFGSAVTVIEALPRLVPREDEDVSAAIADILAGGGIDVRVGAKALAV